MLEGAKSCGNGTDRLTAHIALCIGTKSIGQLVCHYHAGALGVSIYNIVCNKCNNMSSSSFFMGKSPRGPPSRVNIY